MRWWPWRWSAASPHTRGCTAWGARPWKVRVSSRCSIWRQPLCARAFMCRVGGWPDAMAFATLPHLTHTVHCATMCAAHSRPRPPLPGAQDHGRARWVRAAGVAGVACPRGVSAGVRACCSSIWCSWRAIHCGARVAWLGAARRDPAFPVQSAQLGWQERQCRCGGSAVGTRKGDAM